MQKILTACSEKKIEENVFLKLLRDSSDDQQPARRKPRGDPRPKRIVDDDTEGTSIDKKEFTSEPSELSHSPRKDEETFAGQKAAPIADEFGDDSSSEYSQCEKKISSNRENLKWLLMLSSRFV